MTASEQTAVQSVPLLCSKFGIATVIVRDFKSVKTRAYKKSFHANINEKAVTVINPGLVSICVLFF